MKTCRVLAENHKNRQQEVDGKRRRGENVMEEDKERRVFIIKRGGKLLAGRTRLTEKEKV